MPKFIVIDESMLRQRNDDGDDSSSIVIVILIILIIFIIIYLYYVYNNNSNGNKNSFVASAKAQKELGIINKLYNEDPNVKYSEIKSHIQDLDSVKYNQVNNAFRSNKLTAELIDTF